MALKTIKIGNNTITVSEDIANRLLIANRDKLIATGTPIVVGAS